jgi:hypothetical protein
MAFPHSLERRNLERWHSLADQCQRRLGGQQISPGDPGTILKDVNALMECVGPGGIVTQSRNASLPAELLPQLNAKACHPIQLSLKRALLRDYPNLAGIFVLLRVMGLLHLKGNRLAVCPAAWDLWRNLNVTEQYFALLEALLFQAETSVLTNQTNRCEEAPTFETSVAFWAQLSERWRNFDHFAPVYFLGPQGELPPWHLFAQQQLGLIEIRPQKFIKRERSDWGGRRWLVGGARLTAWGTAVTWALLGPLKKAEDEPAESKPAAEFGMLQPIFHPYFPEWQNVYARPSREARLGTHIFKVTLAGWRGGGGGIWRRLAVPPDATLDELAVGILRAFEFDCDHLYDFHYRDHRGKLRVYNHPEIDEGPFTGDIAVNETDLAPKDSLVFTFDYGDYWQFGVRLEKVEAEPCRQQHVAVTASAGKAPAQYPGVES